MIIIDHAADQQLTIMNGIGTILWQQSSGDSKVQVDVSRWNKGIYWLSAVDASGHRELHPFVLQ